MNIFGIGLPEMAVIFTIALLVFGPKKLPEIGRTFGKTLRSFQDASKEFENEFKREAEKVEKAMGEPMKASLEKPSPKALAAQESEKAAAAAAEPEAETPEPEPAPADEQAA